MNRINSKQLFLFKFDFGQISLISGLNCYCSLDSHLIVSVQKFNKNQKQSLKNVKSRYVPTYSTFIGSINKLLRINNDIFLKEYK